MRPGLLSRSSESAGYTDACFKTDRRIVSLVILSVEVGRERWIVCAKEKNPVAGLRSRSRQ